MLIFIFSPWKPVHTTRMETVKMQRWEYRTAQLVVMGLTYSKGWKLKEINEQKQPDWKKAEAYSSVTDFCNQMGQQGWELTSAAYPNRAITPVILYFKRLLQ